MPEDLKAVLDRMAAMEPSPLRGHGDLAGPPPFSIRLAPWATEMAQRLQESFGTQVDLVVGHLRYPQRQPARPLEDPAAPPEVDPGQLSVALDGPLTIVSGHDGRHRLRVVNLTDRTVELSTNGAVTGSVVDPMTGDVVGSYAGFQTMPLVRFRIGPHQDTTVPLLVGTASRRPDLGYAVPPGEWAIVVPLKLGDGRIVASPALPITVTS
jgi:hypothetical protein